jgi:hypothetical protein
VHRGRLKAKKAANNDEADPTDAPVDGDEGFHSIENKIFPTKTNKNKPRSDLRDAKQQAGKLDLHTHVDRTAETFR